MARIAHEYRSPDEWLDFLLALNLPLRLHLADVPPDRIEESRQAATDAMTPWIKEDGHVRFTAYGYYATAARPTR